MSSHRETRFGTTVCHIYVRKHVESLATEFPSVATAFVDDQAVTEEDGEPVEGVAGTDEEAVDRLCLYLEKRYGRRVQ